MTVPLRVTLIVAALVHGGPLFAQTAFKYKFKVGDTLHYDLAIGQKVSGKAGDMEFGGLEKQVIAMTWKVESVDDKGTAKIRLKVDRAKLIADSGKDSVEVSSDAKQEPDKGPAKQMFALAKALAKFEGFFTMNAQGDVEKVTIPPEVTKAMKAVPGAEDAEPMNEAALQGTLRNTLLVLPAEPLTKGKSWKEKLEFAAQFGKFNGDLVYTYEGTVNHGGRMLAKFVVKPQVKVEPDPKAKIVLKSMDSEGTFYFDPMAGQLVEMSTSQTLDLAGEAQGKKITQRNESTNVLKLVP